MDIQIDKLKGPLMHEHKRYIKGPIYQTEYGALYNWYVANDIRGIISNGWRVPSLTDFTSLQTYLGGESDAGGKMKETGILYWGNPNIGASNSSKFNGRAGGLRETIPGYFPN